MQGEYLEKTKRVLTQMRHWWNELPEDELPSIGMTAKYGCAASVRNRARSTTEEMALRMQSLSPEGLRRRKWLICVRDELNALQSSKGKTPNRAVQDKLVANVLYLRAGLGYTLSRIAETGFQVKLSRQRVSGYYGIAVWNVAERAEKAGLFKEVET